MPWWSRNRVQLSPSLYQQAQMTATAAGYSSVDEFVEHCVRQQVDSSASSDDEVLKGRLRGLGYVE